MDAIARESNLAGERYGLELGLVRTRRAVPEAGDGIAECFFFFTSCCKIKFFLLMIQEKKKFVDDTREKKRKKFTDIVPYKK